MEAILAEKNKITPKLLRQTPSYAEYNRDLALQWVMFVAVCITISSTKKCWLFLTPTVTQLSLLK
jgi:hypothetical protein